MEKRDVQRSIPSTIAYSLPDNVANPFWAFKEKMSLADEFFDCYVSFKELHCQEYFWIWQSRKLDEVLMKKLVSSYHKYFEDFPLGKKRFLTFVVNDHNINDLGKMYMSIILSNEFAKESSVHSPPLFEVVHSSGDDLLHLMNLYNESMSISCDKFNRDCGPKSISILPTHDYLQSSASWFKSLHTYLTDYQSSFRSKVEYIRPLIPRNIIADKLGFVASVLATKRTLSNYHAFGEIAGLKAYPIVQASVLPFRGGLSPDTFRQFADNYPGTRSVTISASYRYDFDVEKVIKSIKAINTGLPKIPRKIYSKAEGPIIKMVEEIFSKEYNKTMSKLPPLTKIHDAMKVPEELKTTFALYSLGIPPEFIGTGKALVQLIKDKKIKELELFYPKIKEDLKQAGRLLNKENLSMLAKTAPFWHAVQKDVSLAEDYIGENLGPESTDNFIHRNHTSNVFHNMSAGRKIIIDLKAAAKARHSLG